MTALTDLAKADPMYPVADVLKAIETYGEPELAQLLDGLGANLSRVPLDALARFGEAVLKVAQAKSELAAMQGAVAAADAAADAAEAEALATSKPKT